MQAKIETLHSEDSNGGKYLIYPRTHTKAVINEKGQNIEELINDTLLNAGGRVFVDTEPEETENFAPVNADTLSGYHASEWFVHPIDETAQYSKLADIPNGKWKFYEGHNIFSDYPQSLSDRGLNYGIVTINAKESNDSWKTGTIIATDYETSTVETVHFFANLDNNRFQIIEHLSLAGGLLIGNLVIDTNNPTLTLTNDAESNVTFTLQEDNNLSIGINSKSDPNFYGLSLMPSKGMLGLLRLINGSDIYTILHTGNKPSGTYNGNGSVETRTINIGGIGTTLKISSGNSVGFVDSNGAVTFHFSNKTTTYFEGREINFTNGVLTIATNNGNINANGSTYGYQLL